MFSLLRYKNTLHLISFSLQIHSLYRNRYTNSHPPCYSKNKSFAIFRDLNSILSRRTLYHLCLPELLTVFSLLSTLAGVTALSTHLYTNKSLWYFESRVTAAETLFLCFLLFFTTFHHTLYLVEDLS